MIHTGGEGNRTLAACFDGAVARLGTPR